MAIYQKQNRCSQHRFYFFPNRSIPEHSDVANSPPDCYAPSSFAGSSSKISLPIGTDIHALLSVIRHLPPRQIAIPLTTLRRPPKLLNRLRVVRQVSHCGKPQRTVSTKKPLGFPVFTKLARWALPPWIPQQGFHPLHTGADSLTKTTQIIHWIIWVILISPSKGTALASRQREASLWNPSLKKYSHNITLIESFTRKEPMNYA